MFSASTASTRFLNPNYLGFGAQAQAQPRTTPTSRNGVFHTLHISAASAEMTRNHHHIAHSQYSSLYEVLGVDRSATRQEIKSAFRRLARVVHPDVLASSDGRNGAPADDFMRIHAAYDTLSDPQKRADYDRRHFRQPLTAAAMAGTPLSGISRQRRRSWETDQCW